MSLANERIRISSVFRFVNALNMRATKCATCLDTLHFVRPSSRCAGKFLKYYRADN